MDGPGQRRGGGATAEPVAVLEAAIQRMVQDAKTKALAKAAASAAAFVPATAFQGRRRGYVFTTRGQGCGYYLDPSQPPPTGDEDGSDGEGGEEGREDKAAAAPAERVVPEELLRRAEEEAGEVQTLDARSLRRLAAQLEKKARENLELRMKFAAEPLKFLENEVDLLSQIREIGQVAGSPELYPVLVDGPALPTLLGLLGHENADLAAEVADLLMELTDADAVEDSAEEGQALVAALVEANGLELLFQALSRFDESNEEEAAGVNKALATIEHMAEITPQLAETVFERTGLLKWLLARVRRRASDSNRLYASELLAILMQGREANQRRLGEANGIDAILLSISPYKGRDPQDAEEGEYLENLFDALCSCLMLPENRTAFVAAEGVELMFLLLKAKRASRYGAVKALDFACTL
ncbi:MAG: Catenin-beta-like protein [Monoraphidium minutum]|nr:MAG: Catenin-beta-like protein [Monoraphidium minutum]